MTEATRRLGIAYPIVQGPFGGGLSTELLASTVSNLGGLGSYGAHNLAPDDIGRVVRGIRDLTAKPFAMNLWVSDHDPGGETISVEDYERAARVLEKVDCKKLAKKNKFAAAFADAVKDYARYIEIPQSDLVVVSAGKPFVEVSDGDGYLHRYQRLVAYSKKFRFAKNPCGGEKIFCEAGGSKGAQAFNRLEHALDRAQVHAGSNPQHCKAHLKDAKARADWFAEFHAGAKKSGSWIAGATYKTKKGQKLAEAAFIAAFKDKGQLADDRLLGTYCDSPAKQK